MQAYELFTLASSYVVKGWFTLRDAFFYVGPTAEKPSFQSEWLHRILVGSHVISIPAAASVRVMSAEAQDLAENRGLVGAMFRVSISYAHDQDGLPKTLIFKSTRARTAADIRRNIERGAAREAKAYSLVSLHSMMPGVHHTRSSMWTGEAAILMEDVTARPGGAVGVNLLLGNQIWGVPQSIKPVDKLSVLTEVFLTAADLHARYWCDPSLKRMSWLKGADWYAGKGRASWEVALQVAKRSWEGAKGELIDTGAVKYDPRFVALIDRSFEDSSWAALQRHCIDPAIPWTLSHGDHHASNMLWCYDGSRDATADDGGAANLRHLVLVDWTEVGIWEPTADLGQMMISDVPADLRRAHEKDLLKAYWERLTGKGGVSAAAYPFDACWEAYGVYAVERWIWFLCVLAGMELPHAAQQYFHDQVWAFICDRGGAERRSYVIKSLVTTQ